MSRADRIGTREAAEILDLTNAEVRRLHERGKLTAVRDSNGDRRFLRDEVEALARSRGLDVPEWQPVPQRERRGRLIRLDCPPHVNPDDYVQALAEGADHYAA